MASDEAPEPVPLSELREGERNVRLLPNGKKVIIVKKGDDVRVFGEVCPHLGADLADGHYCSKTNTVHCKWHGYVFDANDGRFVENPNEKFMRLIRIPSEHFKPEKTPKYRLAMVRSNVRDGMVYMGKAAAPSQGGESQAAEQTQDVEAGAE